jgi:hypothetical protein
VGAYGTGTSSNCLEGVFDLEQLIVSSCIPYHECQLTCPSGEKTVKAIISVAQVLSKLLEAEVEGDSPLSYDLDILCYPLLRTERGR